MEPQFHPSRMKARNRNNAEAKTPKKNYWFWNDGGLQACATRNRGDLHDDDIYTTKSIH